MSRLGDGMRDGDASSKLLLEIRDAVGEKVSTRISVA
jgi:hypothetical protein